MIRFAAISSLSRRILKIAVVISSEQKLLSLYIEREQFIAADIKTRDS